jgi:hypothetical protein
VKKQKYPVAPWSRVSDTTNFTFSDDEDGVADTEHDYSASRAHSATRLPCSDFPHFDGDNPKWWKKSCKKYFKLYNVQQHLWVDFSTMDFKGNAALWQHGQNCV